MKERETKISEAAILLERAERLATSDPAAALPVLQEALRACRQVAVQCLENRAFSALGATLALLGRLDHSEAAFRVAYRLACPCCRPVIDRRYAHLLDWQGQKTAAVKLAARAVEGAKRPEKGRTLVTLGTVRLSSGDVSGAVEALTQALDVIPVRSPHHPIALANLTDALARSESPEDFAKAAAMLPGLARRFRGIKRLSQERTKLSWTTGQVQVRLAKEATSWAKRRHLARGRDHIAAAVKGLERLGLLLDAAAARVDLANVQARLDPLLVRAVLEGIPARGEQCGKAFDFSEVKAAAVDAAGAVFSPERIRRLWAALRALRDATVEAGAAPPVMAYAAP